MNQQPKEYKKAVMAYAKAGSPVLRPVRGINIINEMNKERTKPICRLYFFMRIDVDAQK